MPKLSLSEVSKQFNIDRSTIYRAVRSGRLSRSSDGNFDISEVVRCFGEPEPTIPSNESIKPSNDAATQKLIAHLESEVKKYQEREERLMQQIDRMQTLIELKSVAPATAAPQQHATVCDTDAPQHATTNQGDDNKDNINSFFVDNVATLQQNTTAEHNQTLQHATVQNEAIPKRKKRSLFGRVINAVFDNE